jgi:hypothetical protein
MRGIIIYTIHEVLLGDKVKESVKTVACTNEIYGRDEK